MWNHLRLLKIPKNVEALLIGKMKSNRRSIFEESAIVTRKSRQIAYAISQADEYFTAADTVSIATSPLIYFYGMLSLTKAAIIANSEKLLLEDIKYHGLFTRPTNSELKAYSENHEHWRMDTEYAITNDGVVNEFFNITHDSPLPKNSIVRFKDILKINPETGEIYNRYYDEPPRFFPLYHSTINKDPFRIELNPATTSKEIFTQSFPDIENDFLIQDGLLHGQALIIKSKEHLISPPNYMGIYSPIPGGKFLISGLEYESNGEIHTKYICPEVCDYIGMFILGDIVRYKQEFWGRTISGETDGSIALVNFFVSIAKARFPNFILNQIFNEEFKYAASARMM